jgi:succinoglycan biosynthesis transport protein ExoP
VIEPNDQLQRVRRGELARVVEAFPGGGIQATRIEPDYSWEQAVRVLRKRGRFVLVFAGFLILGIGVSTLLMKDVYQPTARLVIDPVNSGIKTLNEIEDSRGTDNQDYLETQVQILQSDSLAVGVIRALHLDRNPEFVSTGELEKLGRSNKSASQIIPQAANADPFLKEQNDLAVRTPLESVALEVFRKRLSVNAIRSSRVVEISYASHDPQLAQAITNNLVTQFIDQSYRARYASTMEASEWLGAQLNDLRQKVEGATQAVSDYQKRYGLVETDDRDVPLGQLMGEVNHQLSDAQANRIEAEAYVRMIDLGQSDAIPAVRDDQLYQNLMTHYVDVRAQLAQTRAIYGDENSNVKKLQDESNEIAAQVEAERTRMVNRVRTSYAAASAREKMMLDAREQLKAQMGDASSHMVAYRMLKNEAMASAQLYNTLQGRLKEAGIYAGLRSSNIRVVDLAPKLEKASGPHRSIIVAMGGMLSLTIALVLAFVQEGFDNTVRTPDDIQNWTGLPSLAVLPKVREDGRGEDTRPQHGKELVGLASGRIEPTTSARFSFGGLGTAESEAFRGLRTSLLLSRADDRPRVVLVSSPAAGEGKSSVAANLACVLAREGKTCLVEGDLRRPQAAAALGIYPEAGLSNVLNGDLPLESCLTTLPKIPNLSILAAGPLTDNPADLLGSDQMRALVQALRNRFEYVVIDSPPILSFSDARILSSLADAVVVVSRHGRSTRRSIIRCTQLLDEVRAPIAGVVLNDTDFQSADYHYYNYGYSRAMNGDMRKYLASQRQLAPQLPEPPPALKKGAHA